MALPELPSNVEHTVRQALREFCLSTKRGIDDTKFLSRWSQITRNFQQSIWKLRPTFMLTENSDEKGNLKSIVGRNIENHDEKFVITIDDSGDCEPDPTPSKSTVSSSKRKQPLSGTPAGLMPPFKKRESNARTTPTRSQEQPVLFTPATERFGTPVQERGVETPLGVFKHEKLSLDNIRREMEEMAKPGMPDAVQLTIHEVLALRSIERWKGPFEAYINETIALLNTMFKQVLEVRGSVFSLLPFLVFCIIVSPWISFQPSHAPPLFGLDVLFFRLQSPKTPCGTC